MSRLPPCASTITINERAAAYTGRPSTAVAAWVAKSEQRLGETGGGSGGERLPQLAAVGRRRGRRAETR
jgi:hypothetical protein